MAHFYLSKGKNFNETLELEGNYGFQSESSFISSMHNTVPSGFSSIKALDREAKQIHTAEVLDISVNGYRIKWSGITPANLKTGEFILVQEKSQSQWRGGVIRWIKQSADKSLKLVWKFSHRNCSLAQSMPVPTNTVSIISQPFWYR